jgi:guanylate kinase
MPSRRPSRSIARTAASTSIGDAPSVIQKRLSVARQEIAQWKHFDYLIISTTIEEDLRRMVAVIEAEKMRQCRAKPPEF